MFLWTLPTKLLDVSSQKTFVFLVHPLYRARYRPVGGFCWLKIHIFICNAMYSNWKFCLCDLCVVIVVHKTSCLKLVTLKLWTFHTGVFCDMCKFTYGGFEALEHTKCLVPSCRLLFQVLPEIKVVYIPIEGTGSINAWLFACSSRMADNSPHRILCIVC